MLIEYIYNMSSEIRVSEKDGAIVFEKDKLSDLEIKFFNPEYFALIGFSDAEIKMINKDDGSEVTADSGSSDDTPLPSNEGQSEEIQSPDSLNVENGSQMQDDGAPEQPDAAPDVGEEGQQEPVSDMANETQEEVQPDAVQPDAVPNTGDEGQLESAPDMANETQEEVQPDAVPDAEPQSDATQDMGPEGQSSLAVETGSNDPNKMQGGYYENVKTLTVPFRHFVYFVQGSEPRNTQGSSSGETSSSTQRTFFTGFSSFFDNIRSSFGNKGLNNAAAKDDTVESKNDTTQSASSASSTTGLSIMWVVKIPIVKEEVDSREMEEQTLNQMIIEYHAERLNNIIVTGERYTVGNRSIKMATTVEEGAPTAQFPDSKLIGTKMDKYAKLNNSNSSNSGFFSSLFK
jgi:hypothetical protein